MTESNFYRMDWLGLEWSTWRSFDPTEGHLSELPAEPGLYRLRHQERDGLIYIGETGRSLRGRVQSLARGTYAEEIPYRDPHTAAPCLWAVRQEDGSEFEVSCAAPVKAEDKQVRKSIEAALIAVYRCEAGESTTANFGRIISGYKQSSSRSRGVVGGKLKPGETDPSSDPGVGPLSWENGDRPRADNWMGLSWSTPEPLEVADSSIPQTSGVYRIWREGEVPPLEYIGQSKHLRNRLYRHRRNRSSDLLYSYAVRDELDAQHKREEIETELIGAHWLAWEQAPRDQF